MPMSVINRLNVSHTGLARSASADVKAGAAYPADSRRFCSDSNTRLSSSTTAMTPTLRMRCFFCTAMYRDIELGRHPNQLGHRMCPHLSHDPAAMHLQCYLADSQFAGCLLVEQTADDQRQHFVLAGR